MILARALLLSEKKDAAGASWLARWLVRACVHDHQHHGRGRRTARPAAHERLVHDYLKLPQASCWLLLTTAPSNARAHCAPGGGGAADECKRTIIMILPPPPHQPAALRPS